MEEKRHNNYTIPVAIVIAGLVIASVLFYINRDQNEGTANTPANEKVVQTELSIPPVTSEDHIKGNPNADFVIVEYSDTECPFCKNFNYSLDTIIDEYGKDGSVAWVYRHFPIVSLHSKAPREAEATECAAELGGNAGFWDYISEVFDTTPSNNGLPDSELPRIAEKIGLDKAAFEQCLNSGKYTAKVSKQLKDAQNAGGRGTPFSIIVAQKPFNNNTLNLIASASAQLPERTLLVSEDKKRMALNGALPIGFLRLILDAAIGKGTSTSADSN